MLRRPGQQLLLARALGGQAEQGLQAGRDAAYRSPGSDRPGHGRQPGDEQVAAAAVAQPAGPDVPVVGMAGDEFRQRELAGHLGEVVVMPLLLGHRPDQVIRQHHPAQPERRAEGLGRGADVGDAPRGHALQRAHRLPVVAELPVVVVLDDQAVRRPRPFGERVPAGRMQGRPGRVLVGGSHHDRARAPPGDPGQGPRCGRRARRPAAAARLRPDRRTISRWNSRPGSSIAIAAVPAAPSTRASSARAWTYPEVITIWSGAASTPRARPRYSASAVRSSTRPRGSP